IRYSFLGKRFVGCRGYPNCRVTYPLPQRGRLDKDQPPCPVCRAPVVTAIEAGRPPWTLCINPQCPSRAAANAKREAKKAAALTTAKKGRSTTRAPTRRRSAASAAPKAEGEAKKPARSRRKAAAVQPTKARPEPTPAAPS
ncbi:MAG: hypothetical protein ACRECR_07050, partial [Thermoplasmata archaeon]